VIVALMLALTAAPVADVANLQLHSAFWPNLHHTLHAAGTPGGRLDSPVKTSLTGSMTDAERRAWEAAIAYYAREISPRDLRTGERMAEINDALAESGDVLRPSAALTADHVAALQAAAPVYRRVLWPEYDRANRAWIADVARRLGEITPAVVPRLSRVYATPWFTKPVRIDITYHGRAYTYLRPSVHSMLASGAPEYGGWAGAEMVLHEVSHALVDNLSRAISRHAKEAGQEPRDLWHLALFYMVGEITRDTLARRNLTYTPFLYSAGVIDRAWPAQRIPVDTRLKRYVADETMPLDAGIRMWLAPELFSFRIGIWNNLHHFLYVLGRARNGVPDMRREPVAGAPGDVEGLSARPDAERRAWDDAVRFYAAGLSTKDAVFDAEMVKVTQLLTAAPDSSDLTGVGLDPQLVAVLKRVEPVYRAVWWPRHARANHARRDELLPLAEKHGPALVKRLTAVFGTEWPAHPRLIDLAAYTSWSGAYSTDGGLIVMATLSESNIGLWGLESMLHEAAHQWDEQFQRRLSAVAAKTGKPLPPQLSHAIIFHTCGELIRELFPDHVTSADKLGIWNRGFGPFKALLDRHWRPYLKGIATFEEAAAKLVEAR
jgi:hypothetical protein